MLLAEVVVVVVWSIVVAFDTIGGLWSLFEGGIFPGVPGSVELLLLLLWLRLVLFPSIRIGKLYSSCPMVNGPPMQQQNECEAKEREK